MLGRIFTLQNDSEKLQSQIAMVNLNQPRSTDSLASDGLGFAFRAP